MKYCKYIISALLLVCLLLAGAACSEPEESETVFCTVTFQTGGGSAVKSMKVREGDLLPVPPNPTKEGYIFDGWRNSSGAWLFDKYRVRGDMTLTAVWIDAKTLFDWESVDGEVTITDYRGDLTEIAIPDILVGFPVTAIGDGAFEGLSDEHAKRIVLGENIVRVGARAFADCEDIEIIVKGKLESVGEQAFLNCNALEEIWFGTGAVSIPYEAFGGCTALETVYLSDTLCEIGENAFGGCTALTRMVAHSALRTVGDSAFVDCDAFAAIFYYGTEEEWQSTDISSGNGGNAAILEAKFYIYSATEPQDAQREYWYFDSNGKLRVW